MRITVSTRHHLQLSEAMRSRALEVIDRLARVGDLVLEATAVFDQVAGRALAEIRLHCRGERVLVATAEAGDHRSALDAVEEKLRRQVRRAQTRPLGLRHAESVT